MLCVMPTYEMPARSPYQKSFRPLAAGVIVLLLIILYISIWTPLSLSDEARKSLAWIAGAVVILAIVAAEWLGIKRGAWKSKQGMQIEIVEGVLIQRRLGKLLAEIPLSQISSLRQTRRWLLIGGSDPERGIAIPTDITGFEELKHEICAGHAVPVVSTRLSASFIAAGVAIVAALFFLVTSRNLTVLIAAACAALIVQAVGTFSLARLVRSNRKVASFLVASYVLEFLAVGWIVYERGFRR